MDKDNVGSGYSKIANKYAELFYDELDYKPLDKYLAEVFCSKIRENGKVCDLGCGPGHISRFIKDEGIDVIGIDISDGMLKEAKEKNPDIEFIKGDMLDLKLNDMSFAGIMLYYSIVHLTISELEQVIIKLRKALEQNGILYISFHVGDNILHVDSLLDENVNLDYMFFQTDEIVSLLKKYKFKIIEAFTREPYEEVEYQCKKGYILCQKVSE